MAQIILVALLLLAFPAQGIPLSDLIGGPPVATGDLIFDDFAASITGDLQDASFYDVAFTSGGFDLTGPLGVADGEVGDLALTYSVSSANGIEGASLFANVASAGIGAQATVDEVLRTLAGDIVGSMSVVSTGGLTAQSAVTVFTDSTTFSPQARLEVVKDILLDSSLSSDASGGSARVSLVEQRFVASVPEPTGALLFGLGCVGLHAAGRRRTQRA